MPPIASFFHGFRIRTRLVIYYATFALLTLSAVVYFSYTQAVVSIQKTMEDKLAVIADLQMSDLDYWVDEEQRNAIFLASLPELRSYAGILLEDDSTEESRENARQQLTHLLGIIVQRTADYHDIQILDLSGDIVISMIPGNNGLSQADQPFFTEGTSRTFSQPFYESPLLGSTAMTVSTPLFDNSQKRVGVLVLHFNMKRVDAIFRESQGMNQSVQSYLIGRDSQGFITGDPIILSQPDTPASVGIDSALNGQEGVAFYTNHDGIPVMGKYFWMPEYNAGLVVEMDEEAALQPARELALNIAFIGIIISILLVIGVIFVAERITAPLRALSEAVARVSAGEMNALAPVTSDDEVGALARAFNAMTEKLQLTLAGLQGELRERKQAQEELLQFRKVMDESSDAIYMIDPETSRYLDFNKS
ncbi:MAG TPA: HAMP domain-containing protein, partial [Anaerolineales bacterium]|nr:HAMP domain-containing protein [Anaerolineales bacterium]